MISHRNVSFDILSPVGRDPRPHEVHVQWSAQVGGHNLHEPLQASVPKVELPDRRPHPTPAHPRGGIGGRRRRNGGRTSWTSFQDV